MKTEIETTIIVGAGLSGLSAAWRLASNGQKCLLLEQQSAPGGQARTRLLDDILFDLGPHYVFPDNFSPGGRLINEVLSGDEVISKEFRYAIITDRRHYKMPIKGDIINYPLKFKKQILANLITRKTSSSPPHSLRYFIESKFGRAYYDEVFGSMIKKKTARDGKDLHVEWYIRPERDFQNDRETFSHKKTITRRLLEPFKTFFTTNRYCYPKKGFGFIGDQLLSRYKEAGGTSIFNCGKIELLCSENRITSCRLDAFEIPVKYMIWTGSADTMFSLIPGKHETALPAIDTIILLLTFNGKRLLPNPYSYTYHPDETIIFNRAYLPENIFGKNSPPDKEGLCLEINWFPHIDTMSEEDIVERALTDTERVGFFKKDSLREARFIRLKKSLPVYGLDYDRQLIEQNSVIRKYQNLYAVGRTGGSFFCMSPAAVNQGLKTADHILNAAT